MNKQRCSAWHETRCPWFRTITECAFTRGAPGTSTSPGLRIIKKKKIIGIISLYYPTSSGRFTVICKEVFQPPLLVQLPGWTSPQSLDLEVTPLCLRFTPNSNHSNNQSNANMWWYLKHIIAEKRAPGYFLLALHSFYDLC